MKETIVQAYESDTFNQALDESLHPGGLDLTEYMASTAGITEGSIVLDVATGRGTSSCFLAGLCKCCIEGIDLSRIALAQARTKAAGQGVSDKVRFHVADIEELPFKDASFDFVVSECSFSLLPDKPTGAAEIARVLKPGGKLAFTDMFLQHRFSDELKGLVPFDCCFTGALIPDDYEALFGRAGLKMQLFEDHSFSLKEITDKLRGEYGSLQAFWNQFGKGTASLCSGVSDTGVNGAAGYGSLWKRIFTEGKPGYCLMVLEKV